MLLTAETGGSDLVSVCCLPLGVTKLGVKKFQAKIGLDNEVSVGMFKKLHFQEVRRVLCSGCEHHSSVSGCKHSVCVFQVSVCKVFKEVTLEMTVDEAVRTRLLDDTAFVKERDYTQSCRDRQELVSQ